MPDGNDNDCDGIVDKGEQTINFEPIDDYVEDQSDIQLIASATSGLDISFIVEQGNVELDGNQLIIWGPGEVIITAYQDGNDLYLPADPVSHAFCILPLDPIITETVEDGQHILTSSADTGNYWYLNSSLIPDKNNKVFIPDEEGSYTLQVIIDQCSSEISDPIIIEFTSIVDYSVIEIDVYPNPTNGWINLKFPAELKYKDIYLTLSDLNGRFILNSRMINVLDGEVSLDLGRYSAGHYSYIIEEKVSRKIYRGQLILY